MTATFDAGLSRGTAPPGVTRTHRVTERTAGGRLVRTVWRTHFYSAILSAPVLLMLAVTGLVILYTGPIEHALYGDLTTARPTGSAARPLQVQRDAADRRAPAGTHLALVVTPPSAQDTTVFQYTGDGATYTDVYVDPYDARVTGVRTDGDDVVGLANRLHGSFDGDSVTVPLPSLAHLIDPGSGPLIGRYPVGDLVIEIAVGWALVLALSGLYLWWPRRSQKGKALLVPRLRKRGRLRWRDVHAVSGILGLGMLVVFITSGMPWSSYWGSAWSSASAKLTPNATADAPVSVIARAGEFDRFGHRISWATRQDAVPGSTPSAHDHDGGLFGRDGSTQQVTSVRAGAPAPLSLTLVARAAAQEHLPRGYTITMPVDTTSDGRTTFGSYQVATTWPARLSTERTVYLDQFTGRTLAHSDAARYGTLNAVTELGVLTHMGTQFGIWSRILMTTGCVLLIVSIVSSLVMWWKRRPTGRAGLPKRPMNPRLPWTMAGIAVVVGIVYPLWGVSAVLLIALDRFVIRRVARLRRTFGMPAGTS